MTDSTPQGAVYVAGCADQCMRGECRLIASWPLSALRAMFSRILKRSTAHWICDGVICGSLFRCARVFGFRGSHRGEIDRGAGTINSGLEESLREDATDRWAVEARRRIGVP